MYWSCNGDRHLVRLSSRAASLSPASFSIFMFSSINSCAFCILVAALDRTDDTYKQQSTRFVCVHTHTISLSHTTQHTYVCRLYGFFQKRQFCHQTVMEGTVRLVRQRTQAFSEVVQELASSVESFESQDDVEWIKEQGEELLELAAQQLQAIQLLEKGAGSMMQMNKDLIIKLQLAQGQVESLEFSSQEMAMSLSGLREDQKMRDIDDNIPRSNKALAKRVRLRAEEVKKAKEEEEEEDEFVTELQVLQQKLEKALEKIEELEQSKMQAVEEQKVEREEMEVKLAAFQDCQETIQTMQIHFKDAQKQAQVATDANVKLQERLEQERLEKAEAVKTRDEELVRLRTQHTAQSKDLEQLKAKFGLLQTESKIKVAPKTRDPNQPDSAKALAAAAHLLRLIESEAKYFMETLGNENENDEGLTENIYEGDMNGNCVTEQQLALGHRKLAAVCNSLRRAGPTNTNTNTNKTCAVQMDHVVPSTVSFPPQSLQLREGEAGRELVKLVLDFHEQVRGIFKKDPKSLYPSEQARTMVHEVADVDRAQMVQAQLLANLSGFLLKVYLDILQLRKEIKELKALKVERGERTTDVVHENENEDEDEEISKLLAVQEQIQKRASSLAKKPSQQVTNEGHSGAKFAHQMMAKERQRQARLAALRAESHEKDEILFQEAHAPLIGSPIVYSHLLPEVEEVALFASIPSPFQHSRSIVPLSPGSKSKAWKTLKAVSALKRSNTMQGMQGIEGGAHFEREMVWDPKTAPPPPALSPMYISHSRRLGSRMRRGAMCSTTAPSSSSSSQSSLETSYRVDWPETLQTKTQGAGALLKGASLRQKMRLSDPLVPAAARAFTSPPPPPPTSQ